VNELGVVACLELTARRLFITGMVLYVDVVDEISSSVDLKDVERVKSLRDTRTSRIGTALRDFAKELHHGTNSVYFTNVECSYECPMVLVLSCLLFTNKQLLEIPAPSYRRLEPLTCVRITFQNLIVFSIAG